MTIPVYGLAWHLNQSPALHELLIYPLSPYLQFKQMSWDGNDSFSDLQSMLKRNHPVVFFQLPPPESLYAISDARIIWIPMWDQARGYDLAWWRRLPKSLKIVSFSREISHRAGAVGLNTLDIRFAISPAEQDDVNWRKPRILLYWNRIGMIGQDFLRKMCRALDVDLLLFRRRTDPGWPSWCDYGLPEKLGKTSVKLLDVHGLEGHAAALKYREYLKQANIFIAPRLAEGVGLSFLEALAKGCAVFAYNAPTMNEYISHKENGYLFDEYHPAISNSIRMKVEKKLNRVASLFGRTGFKNRPPVTGLQNWGEIRNLNLQKMGNHARQEQSQLFSAWQDSLPAYASFISE